MSRHACLHVGSWMLYSLLRGSSANPSRYVLHHLSGKITRQVGRAKEKKREEEGQKRRRKRREGETAIGDLSVSFERARENRMCWLKSLPVTFLADRFPSSPFFFSFSFLFFFFFFLFFFLGFCLRCLGSWTRRSRSSTRVRMYAMRRGCTPSSALRECLKWTSLALPRVL